MINEIKKDAAARMDKSIASLRQELTKLRTGRAHTSLLDHITVEYYGSEVPLNQVANINVEDARTLTVSPWEKSMVQPVEKMVLYQPTQSGSGSTRRLPARSSAFPCRR